jgi:Amidohydrolase family
MRPLAPMPARPSMQRPNSVPSPRRRATSRNAGSPCPWHARHPRGDHGTRDDDRALLRSGIPVACSMPQRRGAGLPMPACRCVPPSFGAWARCWHRTPTSPGPRHTARSKPRGVPRVRRLVEQGVQIVSGSDAGVACHTFRDYPGDLIFTAEGTGLSPVYVLTSAMSIAAEALGCRDLGSIAPGKAADRLAVQGHPLHDIRALTAPRLVVARGRVVACTTER